MIIVSVRSHEVRWTMAGTGAARGRTDRASLIVEVTTSTGTIGRGEAAPLPGTSIDTLADAARAIEDFAARAPFDVTSCAEIRALAALTNTPSARFAIETALMSALSSETGHEMGSDPFSARVAQQMGSDPLFCAIASGSGTVSTDDVVKSSLVDTSAESAAATAQTLTTTVEEPLERVVQNMGSATFPARGPAEARPKPTSAEFAAAVARTPTVDNEGPVAQQMGSDPLFCAIASDGWTEKWGRTPFSAQGAQQMGSDPIFATVVDTAEEARAANTTTLKIKVGPGGDLERVVEIHRAAPDATLRIDANRSWPRERVRERLFALADLPIEFVEEPCERAYELLDEALPVPIALDESLATMDDAQIERALAASGLGALVLKPTVLGGVARCLELAERARAAGKQVVITHALEGPIGTAACEALARAIGGGPHGLAPHPALVAFARPRSVRIASPARDTVDAIHAALDRREPIALVHHKLTASELERQRACVTEAPLPDGAAAILFTSGSTGEARGVVLSRAAIDAAADASAARLGWRDGDRWLLALSTAHAGGLAVVVRCRAAGVPIEIPDDDGRVALATALARCTLASLVPTQLAMLLEDPDWRPPAALRAVLLGGAAAPPALLAEAQRRGVPFLTTYGLTESFGQLATARLERAGDPIAPLVPLPGVTITAGTRARPERIRVSAPMLATSYLDGTPIAPELATSDLGFFEDGALHVVGRADDVIITGGENVHPAQIEAVLAATPGVRAACAFGVPDPRWGQLVGAAIAVAGPFDLRAAAAHWHAALPPHARPRRIATTGALPLLPGGKVDRRAAAALPAQPVEYG